MRLLLDEMHAAAVARALRDEGFDVAAVAEDRSLRGCPDPEVLATAAAADRAVVTENARDFVPLARAWLAGGVDHAGIVLTSPRRFDRSRRAYPGDLVVALRAFLEAPPVEGPSWLWWL